MPRQHPYLEMLCALSLTLTHRVCYSMVGEILSNQNTNHWRLLISPWDLSIPYVPFFILPYLFVWFYAGFVLFYSLIFKSYDHILFRYFYLSFLTLTIIESLLWLTFPASIMIRVPLDVLNNSSWLGSLTIFVYKKATPWNVFPSAHIASSYMILLFSKYFAVSGHRRYFFLISLLICLSVLLIKNHYLADIIAGILLGHVVYRFIFIPTYKSRILDHISTPTILFFSYVIYGITILFSLISIY